MGSAGFESTGNRLLQEAGRYILDQWKSVVLTVEALERTAGLS
jgi:hypothetical protein